MGRPRRFDEPTALTIAQNVFWQLGYEAATLDHLLRAMGLSKSSFYETFGSKRALFLRSLHHYQQEKLNNLAKTMTGAATGRAAILQILDATIKQEVGNGCMICNETVELAGRDDDVKNLVDGMMVAFEHSLIATIDRGKADGSITTQCQSGEIARLILVCLNGLHVMARGRADPDRLHETVQFLAKSLI